MIATKKFIRFDAVSSNRTSNLLSSHSLAKVLEELSITTLETKNGCMFHVLVESYAHCYQKSDISGVTEQCKACGGPEERMAGAFGAKKVRQNMERGGCEEELPLYKYSSKYMDSIWGNYNRLAVHNLKKIMGDEGRNATAQLEQGDKKSGTVIGAASSTKNILSTSAVLY